MSRLRMMAKNPLVTAGVTSALCGVGVAVVANIPGEGVNEYQRTGRRPDDPESWSAGLALALTAWDITTGERHGPFHPAGVPDEEWCLTRSLGAVEIPGGVAVHLKGGTGTIFVLD
ncbi:hypothetical protein [Actinomadura welshii]|uniref:hypothetical protein n=1 Tax=Actinomadura welshii TaxID=3103817 RepID=UPI0003AD4AA2|nr:hypothetical protein [Actinomadura madurae]